MTSGRTERTNYPSRELRHFDRRDPASVISVNMFGTIRMAEKSGTERKPCYRCGKVGHFPNPCRFKDAYCHAFGKKGHIAPVCKSVHTRKSSPMQVDKKPGRQKSKLESKVHDVGRYFNDPVNVKFLMNGKRLSMGLDTGVEVSINSEETRKEKFPEEELRHSGLKLKTYTVPMSP